MLVFPLLNFSVRGNLDELLFSMNMSLVNDNKKFLEFSFSILISCFLAAISIREVWYFFKFLGSTSTVFISFIFPSVIFPRIVNGISTLRENIVMLALVVAISSPFRQICTVSK